MNFFLMAGVMVLMLVFFHRGRHHGASHGHAPAEVESKVGTPKAPSEDRNARGDSNTTPPSEPADEALLSSPGPGLVPPASP